ncbi:hypothetical protein OSB04_012049 [Centaurea solstitialis]|uniref:PB1 domain-containing protein n=1 Tax=Centaurea solstitialis TaxID=347529 RepID=A0AA38WM40_9ASTR|nr:hypothetical protein OSB04_012049 [Centaurea solstitialis]
MPIADVDSLPNSSPGSASASPTNRLKFLCSHGGKILPRPADGRLKYVGGETRVICVHRDVTISELMRKLTSMFDGEMVLKYQLLPEDLDILVTVKSDEDLRHMIEECDRHELLGAPRLRAFLFSSNNPIVIENQMGPMDHRSLEQRYINSVNGIVVSPTQTYNTAFSASSTCSSPRTPPEITTTIIPPTSGINPDFTTSHGKPGSLSRKNSSASLCNLYCNSPNNHQISSPNWNQNHHHHHQPPPQPHQYPPQPVHSPKPPLDRHPHKGSGSEHLGRTRSTGIGDYYRHAGGDHNNHPRTTNRGGGGHIMSYQRGSAFDDYYGSFRCESPPGSPLARSPSGGVSPSPSVKSGRW